MHQEEQFALQSPPFFVLRFCPTSRFVVFDVVLHTANSIFEILDLLLEIVAFVLINMRPLQHRLRILQLTLDLIEISVVVTALKANIPTIDMPRAGLVAFDLIVFMLVYRSIFASRSVRSTLQCPRFCELVNRTSRLVEIGTASVCVVA